MKYKIAIVGGAGFVGSSLAKYFVNDFDVKVLDMVPVSSNLEDKVDYAKCDIRKFDEVRNGINDADLIINTAIVQIPLINERKQFGYEVNILGTQNICKAVHESHKARGLILSGTWHVIGERGLRGLIDEEFGFRPDKVEERARLYALSKITQETLVRFYDEFSEKVFGIIRMGTVLGEGMPKKTAANIFVDKGLMGEPITPFSHSMYRPMLYVDIMDVCMAFKNFAFKILSGNLEKNTNSLEHITNVYYPEPITILDLAKIIRNITIEKTNGKVNPPITIVNTHPPILFSEEDKKQIKVNIDKAINLLKFEKLKSPKDSLEQIIELRLKR